MTQTKKTHALAPFAISLADYQALDPDEAWELTQALYAHCGDWIRQQFEQTGAALLAVCDHQVVYSSFDRYDFQADEVVEQIQRESQKPCFILTRPVPVEESCTWADLGQGDCYPTLKLSVGARTWSDPEVFSQGVPVTADFDTGNPVLAVFDEALCFRLTGETRPLRQDLHLGRPYRYRPRLMKLGLIDGRTQRVVERVVEGVEAWGDATRNPFKLANPGREGFVGRDLMLQALFRITLDPRRRESSWVLL